LQRAIGAPTNLQAARVADFYRYFDRQQRVDDWLARLHGIATASGLELRAGNYRLAEAQRRIDRYEISLPVSGSYTQIRSFLEGALAEIPVLSLDQASFRRKGTNETRIEAEIVLTLHLLHK
jgi:Tfp pilus assembly protein PilO